MEEVVLSFLLVGRIWDICSKRQLEVIVWIGGKDTVYGKLTTLRDTFYHAGGGKTSAQTELLGAEGLPDRQTSAA